MAHPKVSLSLKLSGCILLLTSAVLPSAELPVPPGAAPCFTNALPLDYGSFVLLKAASYIQSGSGAPAETDDPRPLALLELTPPAPFMISNAVVTGPGGFQADLALLASGASTWTNGYTNEAALTAALPPGTWSTRFQVVFTNMDPFVGFFPFEVGTNLPPVPQVSNLQAAQSINPGSPFTLSWNEWSGASTNDRISLAIVNGAGQTVVSAATDCAGEFPLEPGATSFEIPAGSLPGGTTYTGYLTFGAALFSEQDDSALLLLRGYHARTTRFTLSTGGSPGGGELATIEPEIVGGTNLVLAISGVPGADYQLQSSSNLIAWLELQTLTLPPSGETNVTIALEPGTPPLFYRAVRLGGGGEPGEGADLGISLTGTNRLSIVIAGTAGASYTLEVSTNYVDWAVVDEVTIPTGTNQVTVEVDIPANSGFAVFRAFSEGGEEPPPPPPPPEDGATLTVTREESGFRLALSGGEPQREYVVQRTDATFTTWTDTTLTITADATGAGSTTVTPAAGENAGFYRLFAR